MAVDLYIDIENSAGQRQGSGPITSAARWRSTARMSKAGTFEFEMPAADPKAMLVRRKYIARAYADVDGQRIEVGAGIIDRIERVPRADGTVTLRVGGDDLLRELTYRSVLNLRLYDNGDPVSHAAAVAAVGGYAPPGWTFAPDAAPPHDSVYGYFNGETVLAGMIKVAEKSRTHFYRGDGRSLVFASSFTPSGVRAIQATGDLSPTTCAIVSLSEQIDTYDLLTRIYPRGSGNADVQLTLRATTRSAPPGYTLNSTDNYIEHTDAAATYGRIERQVGFRDIGPIENTDADVRAAANALFDAALEHLRRHSSDLEQATYTLSLAGCRQLLRPMQSIRVVYRDRDAGLDIDTDLNILEATWQVDAAGIHTTDLVVSNADRWPQTDAVTIVDSVAEGKIYQALPQLNANSYVAAYTKNVDADNTASFRFRFGREVTQLQQVLFEFQLLPFESTLKSIGTETGASQLETGGPSTNSTGQGGLTSTGMGGPTATGSGGGGNTGGSGTLETNANPFDTRTTGENPLLSRTTGGSGQLTTAGSGTLTTNEGGGSNTGEGGGGSTDNSDTLETGDPQGGDVDQNGHHNHAVRIIAQSGSLGPVELHWDQNNDLYFFASPFVGGLRSVFVTPSGIHTHDLDPHTHAIDPHTHAIDPHTHTIPPHTHTISPHTHTIPAHTHTMPAHTHTMPAHTHTIPSHTHTMPQHTHSLSQHTHSLSDHTHSLAGSIRGVYGIFRESAANTFDVDELEYRVNSGAWLSLGAALPAGDGWYQLDVTSLVMDSTTFRPLRTNNLIEMRGTQNVYNILSVGRDVSVGRVIASISNNSDFQVGQSVRISGTANYDGDYTVDELPDSLAVVALKPGRPDGTPPEVGGTLTMTKRATIDAQLSVRSIIQAVAYI